MTPPLPRLTPTHDRLAALAGAWRGPERLAPSPWSPGGPAVGTHTFAVGAGGFALVQDYREERAGVPALTGHGVFAVEPGSEDVLWFWFDSIGHPPAGPSRGRFDAAGTTLVLEKTTPRGVQRATFARDGDALRHRLDVRLAGEDAFATLVTADYARTAEAAPERITVAASTRHTAPAPANASSAAAP
jgi:hypothetical protein